MKWLNEIDRSDWIIMICYALVLWQLQFWGEWLEEDWSFWSKDTRYLLFNICAVDVLKQMVMVVLIVFYIVPTFFEQKKYLLSFSLIILILLVSRLLDFFLLPYTSEPLLPDPIPTLLFGVLNYGEAISFPCFLLLARSFYQSKIAMVELQKEQKETELKVLQAQVDPHFLFNNLNILDILIEEDPVQAQAFTRKLSALYRYMIRHKDEEVVSLATEWQFCEDYMYLIEQRFRGLFPLEDKLDASTLFEYLIPPAALQTILENVIKHNAALPDSPIPIRIELAKDSLIVTNEYQPKSQVNESSGTGLQNIATRLALLTEKTLTYGVQGHTFRVELPLVKLL